MGRHLGYIAIQCGIGGGAEIVMVAETSTKIKDVIGTLKEGRDNQKTSSIVVVAEGDEQGNAHDIAAKVSSELPELDIRVFLPWDIYKEGGSHTSYDRILSLRLGMAAVEGLINGEKSTMVGIATDSNLTPDPHLSIRLTFSGIELMNYPPLDLNK